MFIEKIRLKDFRNFSSLEISSLSAGINIIYGPNGSGKTNLLEALSLSSLAKSCRAAQDFEMVKLGRDSAAVEIEGTVQKKKLISNSP
jgi:DNA replication and repair protein RecF